jgi:hypothetical protein
MSDRGTGHRYTQNKKTFSWWEIGFFVALAIAIFD